MNKQLLDDRLLNLDDHSEVQHVTIGVSTGKHDISTLAALNNQDKQLSQSQFLALVNTMLMTYWCAYGVTSIHWYERHDLDCYITDAE